MLDFFSKLGPWAPFVVFAMATGESAAFLGFVFPGEVAVILGGVLGGVGCTLLGYFAGGQWPKIERWFRRGGFIVVGVVAVGVGIGWWIHRRRRQAEPSTSS